MNWVVFDTEDNSKELLAAGRSGFEKKVTQIAAKTAKGNTFYNKGNVPEFLKWIRQSKEKNIFAHNCQYDLGNLFAESLDCLDVTLVKSRMIRARWGNKSYLDSFNLWPMSAKKIGAAFGLEKLEMDVQSKEYVFRDVEIIWRAINHVQNFCDSVGIDMPATLGGLAMNYWRSLGETNCHDSAEISREALFGGRVELFKTESESESVAYCDINSLYPDCMRGLFPGHCEPCQDIPKMGVVDCTVKVPETAIAPLPLRDNDGKIIFPWGRFRGVWTVAELSHAIDRGASIQKIHRAYGSSDKFMPYRKFVERLYELRMTEKSEAGKLFYKLLMNNLYGRLGSSGVISRSLLLTSSNAWQGYCYGNKVLADYTMPLDSSTNWIHAAHVTAFGRIRLLEYLEKVGEQQIIYCDTDSVIFDEWDLPLPFSVSGKLGAMKLVKRAKKCLTFAPKMYAVDGEYKAKGVPQRLAKRFVQRGLAEFDLPFKLREAIIFFDRENARKLSVWRKVCKQFRCQYDRKKLVGKRYFPFKVNRGNP